MDVSEDEELSMPADDEQNDEFYENLLMEGK